MHHCWSRHDSCTGAAAADEPTKGCWLLLASSHPASCLAVNRHQHHRLMFNFFVHQCKDLRAETIALISKHKLGHPC